MSTDVKCTNIHSIRQAIQLVVSLKTFEIAIKILSLPLFNRAADFGPLFTQSELIRIYTIIIYTENRIKEQNGTFMVWPMRMSLVCVFVFLLFFFCRI